MSPDLQGRVADMINESFVGIDVSKAWLDVGFLATGSAERLAHDEVGIAGLCQRLCEQPPP